MKKAARNYWLNGIEKMRCILSFFTINGTIKVKYKGQNQDEAKAIPH